MAQLDVGSIVNDLLNAEAKAPGFLAAFRAGVVKAEGSTMLNFLLGRIVADPKAAEAEVVSAIDSVSAFLPEVQSFLDPALKLLLNLKPATPAAGA